MFTDSTRVTRAVQLSPAEGQGSGMEILAISQNKGGTGKTTTGRMIAEGVARAGRRVLCIDLDPQCNLSQRFLVMDLDTTMADSFLPPVHPEFDPLEDTDWNGRCSIADIFIGKPVVPYPTAIPNLNILPGSGDLLRRIELVDEAKVVERVHNRLKEFLDRPEILDLYDLVVIDTSPSKGPLTRAALRAATHVMVPTTMTPMGVEGLQGMLMMWQQENRSRAFGNRLDMIGILPNMFRNVAIQEGLLESLKNDEFTGPLMMDTMLSLRTIYTEQDHESNRPKSIFNLPANNPARREVESMVNFVGRRIGVLA